MRWVSDDERRARIGVRHGLSSKVRDALEATRAMTALHSSDPSTVYLSAWARVRGFAPEDLEGLLYEDRALVRFYGMRRTLWVMEDEMVPIVHHSSTKAIGHRERARTVKLLEEGGITDDGEAWLSSRVPLTLEAIRVGGQVLTRDLTKRVDGLTGKLVFHNAAGDQIGTTGVGSRLLTQLALESRVVRGRPAGSWTSGQYRWSRTEDWLDGPIAEMPGEDASAGLLTRWLTTFGPATETDVKWWTGWPLRQVRAAIAGVGAVEVELEGTQVGYLLPHDLDVVHPSEPWVALLPSLDPTTMGWKQREWYMGQHTTRLFDRNGNAGPTIWTDGRVVGGWAQRKDGVVVCELLEDVGAETAERIEGEIARLQEWLGETIVTPRFRSPSDRALAS